VAQKRPQSHLTSTGARDTYLTSNTLTGVASSVVLGAILPAIVVYQATARGDLSLILIEVVVSLYAALRLSVALAANDVRVFTAVFWLFTYVAFGIAPLAQSTTGNLGYFGPGVTLETLRLTSILVLVGCVAFDLAQLYARPKWIHPGRVPPTIQPLPPQRRLNMGPLRSLAAISIALSTYYVVSLGGLTNFFSSRQALNEVLSEISQSGGDQTTRALIGAVGTAPALVSLLCFLIVRRDTRPTRSTWDDMILFALIAVNVVVNNPISNPRFWALAAILAVAFVWVGSNFLRFRWVMYSGVAGAVLLFPLSDVFRYDAAGRVAKSYSSVWETIAVKDFDQFPMAANALAYTSQHGFSFGEQLAGILFFWVPRSIWPGKPLDTGVVLGEFIGSRNTNLSSPLITEGWVNFGVIGVVGVMIIWGFVAAFLDSQYRNARSSPSIQNVVVQSLILFLASYQLIILRGPLLQSMGRLASVVLIVCGVILIAKAQADSRRYPRMIPSAVDSEDMDRHEF
jgi:hypothetical protein